MPKYKYKYTIYPSAPCAYCAQFIATKKVRGKWVEKDYQETQWDNSLYVVAMMPTYCSLVLYRGIHKECNEMMTNYLSESYGY